MMISAVRRTNKTRRSGFTLLEMVVVLSISMLVVGGALSALYFSRDESKLNDAVQSVEVLAKRARTVARLQQRPYALEFSYGAVSMMPLAEAMMSPTDRESLLEDREFYGDEAPSSDPGVVRDSWQAEEEMQLFIKRWATTEWQPITRNTRQVWRFDPNGICEPVGVRFEVERSWISVIFHPLTASIADVESEIQ